MTPRDYCTEDLGHEPGALEYATWLRARLEQYKADTGRTLENPSGREMFRIWLCTRPVWL